MLKALSFNEAIDFMDGCNTIVHMMETYLGEAGMNVLSDAVNLFAQNPEHWGCDEDADYAALMALAFSRAGFNHLLPEHDVTLKFMIPSRDA